jgi:hypothetical protein
MLKISSKGLPRSQGAFVAIAAKSLSITHFLLSSGWKRRELLG